MRIPMPATLPFATVLLASFSLGACATAWKPPQITYDDTPRPAVLQPDPPRPVQVVAIPTPLPLPGQMKPIPNDVRIPADAGDPAKRVATANAAARVQPGQDRKSTRLNSSHI